MRYRATLLACLLSLTVFAQDKFDATKWKLKDGDSYPHRAAMVQDIFDRRPFHGKTRAQVIQILGQPDRVNGDYLYYLVSQEKFGVWPISTKTLVLFLNKEGKVQWVKLHG